jgi:epoxyqueuosine reductase
MSENALKEWAARKGYRVAWAPGTLLGEVQREIAARAAKGEPQSWFAQKWLGWLTETQSQADAQPETVIVVAVPCPACTIRFMLPERVLTTLIPPTYVEDNRANEEIRRELIELLPELNGDLELVGPARKALAARLGLTSYGLNNISYSEGMGSHIWLGAFATSARLGPCLEPKSRRAETLAECETCGRCRDACPTGAIAQDRFLLRAERCLTCWNELPGPWPSWIPPNAHNCLVGCMVYQEVCPCNDGLLKTVDSGVLFDEAETKALIASVDGGAPTLEASIRTKLDTIAMSGYMPVIGRNVAALADRNV